MSRDISKEDARKIVNHWASEGIHPRGLCDAMWAMVQQGKLKMVHNEKKGYCFVNAMTEEELRNLPETKIITCECGETITVCKGTRFYLNPVARGKFRNSESYAEIVGFSRKQPDCVWVIFEGSKSRSCYSICHFHDSSGHRQWEAKIRR